MANRYLLAIDQGTTSTRAVIFDAGGRQIGSAGRELTQHYPQPGWVEHDPEEIWESVLEVVPQALANAKIKASDLTGIGITNQRETVVIWDRASGKAVARALVWQDRRTTDYCRDHKSDEPWLSQQTGLVLDPYFSGTKIRWLLEKDPELKRRAQDGKLACGTIDSFLIWRLTDGKVHATDVTNASRTLLMNLHTAKWDQELCRYFGVPQAMLPEIRPSAADFGKTGNLSFLSPGTPIAGVAGDQQAALFGQCGFQSGDAKCTYGTGAFVLLHTGNTPIHSQHKLLSTFAATTDEKPLYALEGSIFIAGAAVQWLRDGLKLFSTAADIEAMAKQSDPDQPIYFIPGFVGLGAPHWVPEARGVIFGLTRGTTGADLARAALEGVAYQVVDLIDAAGKDAGAPLQSLRVDGGMARNAWFLQCQADLLGKPVLQAPYAESTALGAAFLAGLKVGIWANFESLRRMVAEPCVFEPRLPEESRRLKLTQWRKVVQAVIGLYKS
ncbi:MAG TPA: glycerol kinase GlpK [Gemmataceae bacterium]|jgi:glycerol kinase|nr:glycerol kinase GlpK [Gemmataceae bacterium]